MSSKHPAVREKHEKAELGFWLYLMTDLILFSCLFATYVILRGNTAGGPDAAALFEATLAADRGASAKTVANWVTGEYLRLRHAAAADAPARVGPAQLAALVRLVDDGAISRANAKEVLAEHVTEGTAVAAIVADRGFTQISDTDALGAAVDDVLASNPNAVADYLAGKQQAAGFLVGQVMKATKGQANPQAVEAALAEELNQ